MGLNYTKGPWKKDILGITNDNNEQVIMTTGPGFGSASSWPQAEANSKLVMHSPEMYEILKLITTAETTMVDDNKINLCVTDNTVSKLVKLIRKIEG